jgi:hypothetical protein
MCAKEEGSWRHTLELDVSCERRELANDEAPVRRNVVGRQRSGRSERREIQCSEDYNRVNCRLHERV